MSPQAKPKKPVVILHGYSDKSQSFQPLASFLKQNGFQVIDIWLADYLSMNDEITIYDLGQAMGTALTAKGIDQSPKSFSVVAHSTGALVTRAYLYRYFYGQPEKCPINNLLLLAPANFGSPLAALGKSMLGRLFNGWDWDHFFQTGTRVLEALELASPVTWELAHRDLFDPENQVFRTKNIFTTILVGSSPYDGMKSLAHENGSDGTVRVSTANLNVRSFQLSFPEPNQISFNEVPPQYDPIAFGVLYGYNHGTICNPNNVPKGQSNVLAELVVDSLAIQTPAAYRTHLKRLQQITRQTFDKASASDPHYHEYQNLTTRVRDQFGENIPDYFLEFFQEDDDPKDRVMKKMQSEVLEKVRTYSKDSSYRSFLFDMTDLNKYLAKEGAEVDLSISVAAKSERIFYRNPEEHIKIADSKQKDLLIPNATLLLDIEVPRLQSENVFRLTRSI